jgi:L-malate glycosyltransferase
MEEDMRITFVVPNLNFSGGIKVIKRHCVELNKLGHDAQMWYPMTQYRGINYPYSHCYYFEHQIRDSDVVIATAWETAQIVAKLPMKKGRKMYFIQHYEQWDYHNGGEKKREIEDTYSLPLEHIYVSRFISKHISPFDVNYIAHNGVDPQPEMDKDYSIPRILYPWRQERWKGNETLDAALAMLNDNYPGVEVKQFGKPMVVDTKQLDSLFRWANIFVYPSWIEGFGLPPLEAASYGCAVVSTTSNAMPELFRNNEMIWCKPYDSECLYEGMKRLIKSSEERERLGTVSWLRSQIYTPERAAMEFLDCLEY